MYQPSEKILKKYADVLVKFAAGGGKGVKKGEVVLLQVPECAKPLLKHLLRSVIESGANPIIQFLPDDVSREVYEISSNEQLSFFPAKYLKGKIDQIDHSIGIIAESDKHELEGIDSKKIMLRVQSMKPYIKWRDEKENQGKYTWVLAMYGTKEMAKEVHMSMEEYWNQIIKACFLDENDPIKKWKDVYLEMGRVVKKMNTLKIKEVRVEAKNTDIVLGLGEKRIWQAASGRNVPTFEIFTSPDWRTVNGHVQFTEPLYIYGNLVKDVYLEFKDGIVTKSTASKGEKFLKDMIAVENANKVGEFSMTDGRLSKITKFMGETLYDENVGGSQGNSHIAVGRSFDDCYDGNPMKVSDSGWKKLGFNKSAVHTDIVMTSRRKVTATLQDDSKKVIYDDGKFLI